MEIKKCKRCSKTLVGKDKYICASCKDVLLEYGDKVGKGILGIAALSYTGIRLVKGQRK